MVSRLAPILLLLAFGFAATQCHEGPNLTTPPAVPPAQRPTLTFYHIPDCFLCADVRAMLTTKEQENRKFMHFRTIDYHLDSSQEMLKRFQIGHHGMVITDPEGDELWSTSAHYQTVGEIEQAIDRVLGKITGGG